MAKLNLKKGLPIPEDFPDLVFDSLALLGIYNPVIGIYPITLQICRNLYYNINSKYYINFDFEKVAGGVAKRLDREDRTITFYQLYDKIIHGIKTIK